MLYDLDLIRFNIFRRGVVIVNNSDQSEWIYVIKSVGLYIILVKKYLLILSDETIV